MTAVIAVKRRLAEQPSAGRAPDTPATVIDRGPRLPPRRAPLLRSRAVKPRDLLTQLSAGRIALGATLIVKPQLVTGMWLGRDGQRPAIAVLGRGFGARDAVLGAGTLAGDARGQGLRPWVYAGLLADAADLLATHFGRDHLPKASARLIYALAGGALVAASEPRFRG